MRGNQTLQVYSHFANQFDVSLLPNCLYRFQWGGMTV